MHHADYLPVRDIAFLAWVDNLIKKLPDFMEKTGFPIEVYQQLSAQYDDFAQAYQTAIDPGARTGLAVSDKNRARTKLEKNVRQAVRAYLNYNPILTDLERINLGLAIHKTGRTRIPVPHERPVFIVTQIPGNRLSVHYRTSGEVRRQAKPFGVSVVEIAWAILAEPPKKHDDIVHRQSSTRSPCVFQFDMSDAGKRCYFCLRWENTRGEAGPWSDIKNAIIP